MTTGAAIHHAGADGYGRSDVAYTIVYARTLALHPCEFTLEKLAATANGAKRVTLDDVQRRARSVDVSPASSDLLTQRFVYPCVDWIEGLGVVDHLCPGNA